MVLKIIQNLRYTSKTMKKIFFATIALFTAALFVSCASVKEVPEDKTAAQIIQMGQNAVSAGDYKSALLCYSTTIERFGSNPATYVEARYEMGNVYLKQKRYENAYGVFKEILDLYSINASVFPPAYKKLSQLCITKIPEKTLVNIRKNPENTY